MSRAQQDQLIDDEESECCPLCVEEFDLSDRNFRPCPCGYQICQFCYNNIKTTMNGLCPACRRQYDDKNIEWKVISSEEMATYKADLAQQAKKKAAARQKEAQKREADSQSRKHLAGLRVVQKNLVYVTGLSPNIREDKLLQTLRGDQYFGQYGKINKIVVSKAKDPSHVNQSVGVYVTFARKQDAATCISAVDGSQNGDRVLRAQYGTTKYCSAYLRGETCTNRNCMFLHEPGEESESFTRQDLSSMNVISTQQPNNMHLPLSSAGPSRNSNQLPSHQVNTLQAISQPMGKQDSIESSGSATEINADTPALPSTANWANKASHSQEEARNSPSLTVTKDPQPAKVMSESKSAVTAEGEAKAGTNIQKGTKNRSRDASKIKHINSSQASDTSADVSHESSAPYLDGIMKSLSESHLSFVFAASKIDPDEMAVIQNFPALFDVNSGSVEQMRRGKKNGDLYKQEAAAHEIMALGAAPLDEHNLESGSLQLGGEPEERQNALYGRGLMRLFQSPSELNQTEVAASNANSSFALTGDVGNLSLHNRPPINHLQQQQQQQKQNYMQQLRPAMTAISSFESLQNSQAQAVPSSLFNASSGSGGHARQASRYTFANDSASASVSVKPVSNAKFMSQQSSLGTQGINPQLSNTPTQPGFGNQVYANNNQGSAQGMKNSGMPINNTGMFGQGLNLASGGINYGMNHVGRNSNEEMLKELLRARSGVHGSQIPGIGKHDEFPPLVSPQLAESQDRQPIDELASKDSSSILNETVQSTGAFSAHSLQPPWLWSPPIEDKGLLRDQIQKRTTLPISVPLAGLGADVHAEQSSSLQIATVSEENPRDSADKAVERDGKPANKKKDHVESVEKVPKGGKKERLGPTERSKEVPIKEDKKRHDKTKSKADAGRKLTVDGSDMSKSVMIPSLSPQRQKKSENVVSGAGSTNKKANVETAAGAAGGKVDKVSEESQSVPEPISTPTVSPFKRQMQPKTLRVLPPSKAENLADSSLSLSSSDSAQVASGKATSRQGSIASVNPPGTPFGDLNSDQNSATSTSVSRPNSPQQNSKQAQIPTRTNGNRNKAKQEKNAQPLADDHANATDRAKLATEEPAPVPIVGRKKKSKKAGAVTPTQLPNTAMSKLELKMQDKEYGDEAANEPEKSASQPDASEDTPTDASPQKPPQTAASVISSLQATGSILISALEFFKPASGLNYRHALAQADLHNRDRKIQLSDEDITRLNNHETVRLNGNDERNSSRALISPSGACLRGLSKEQEDKFLDLESRIANDKPPTKYFSNKISTLEHAFPVILPTSETAVPPPTATQLKATDEVLAYNDQFVLQPALQGHPSDRRLQNDASSAVMGLKVHKPGEISLASLGGAESNLLSTSMMPSPSTAKHAISSSSSTLGAAPLLTVDEAEAAVSRSRKETEALEKKLNALIKKNRRLAFSSA